MNTSHSTNSNPPKSGSARSGEGLCPYVNKPLEDCYCKQLTSLQVADAVFYCTRNFPICPVYKSMLESGPSA